MYYEHYFYFAVNLLINTSCAFLFLPACLLAFFFCTFTWFAWKDVSWLCDQENGFGPLMRVGSPYFLC